MINTNNDDEKASRFNPEIYANNLTDHKTMKTINNQQTLLSAVVRKYHAQMRTLHFSGSNTCIYTYSIS